MGEVFVLGGNMLSPANEGVGTAPVPAGYKDRISASFSFSYSPRLASSLREQQFVRFPPPTLSPFVNTI